MTWIISDPWFPSLKMGIIKQFPPPGLLWEFIETVPNKCWATGLVGVLRCDWAVGYVWYAVSPTAIFSTHREGERQSGMFLTPQYLKPTILCLPCFKTRSYYVAHDGPELLTSRGCFLTSGVMGAYIMPASHSDFFNKSNLCFYILTKCLMLIPWLNPSFFAFTLLK